MTPSLTGGKLAMQNSTFDQRNANAVAIPSWDEEYGNVIVLLGRSGRDLPAAFGSDGGCFGGGFERRCFTDTLHNLGGGGNSCGTIGDDLRNQAVEGGTVMNICKTLRFAFGVVDRECLCL